MADEETGPGAGAAPRRTWRVVSFVAFVVAGALFATSGRIAEGLDLRAASVTDLTHVVRGERDRADRLQDRVAELNREIDRLGRSISDTDVSRVRREAAQLRLPAGFEAVHGPGLTVVLDDAPPDEIKHATETGDVPREELLVHQQDIQGVVNALWAGGAEAMTVQGQRIVSTTGIKCVGNTVVLHGVPYSPPYRISAIGDPDALQGGLDASPFVAAYLTYVEAHRLGWDVTRSDDLRMPAYEGSATLKYAEEDVPQTPSRSSD